MSSIVAVIVNVSFNDKKNKFFLSLNKKVGNY